MCKVNRREFLVGSTALLSAAAEEELLHGVVPAGAAIAGEPSVAQS
jgi:hypothetical protein